MWFYKIYDNLLGQHLVLFQRYFELLLTGTEEESFAEEVANSITHGVGVLLAFVATYFLILVAIHFRHSWQHWVGLLVYGLSLIVLYSLSTTYHVAGVLLYGGDLEFYRVLDHIGIFFLIAGTYTPLVLLILVKKGKSFIGFSVLIFCWGCAFVGSLMKLIGKIDDTPLWQHCLFYLLMGLSVLAVLRPVMQLTPKIVLYYIFLGGGSYVFGVFWLLFHPLVFNHAIWHLFVLGGSFSHYIAVLIASMPSTSLEDSKFHGVEVPFNVHAIIDDLAAKREKEGVKEL